MDNYLLEMIQNDNIFWTKGDGNAADVVLSTRIRLARNYKEYPFSTKINEQQSRELLDNLRSAMVKEKDLYFFDLSLSPKP
jgi:protein arginine kinase